MGGRIDTIAIYGDTAGMKQYPGGKAGAGVYQQLINFIPPHHTYIETHLGGGAVMRYKRSAKINIGIDVDPAVIETWQGETCGVPVRLVCEDAVNRDAHQARNAHYHEQHRCQSLDATHVVRDGSSIPVKWAPTQHWPFWKT